MPNQVINTTQEALSNPMLGLMMALPGGIEAQEAQGQSLVCMSDVLPTECGERSQWEAVGFVFGDPVKGDDLFVNVTYPAGWTKKRTDHSMYSDILDEQGRKRGSIGYKAAFYDRSASAHLVRRLRADVDYESETSTYAVVKAGDVVLFKTGVVEFGDQQSYEVRSKLVIQCAEWLKANYPDYKNVLAYWDLDVENGEFPTKA